MKFLVKNPFTGENFEFENKADAEIKATEIRAESLIKESHRFNITKEVVNGNDTIWMNADLDNDDEDYNYYLFNTYTEKHEFFSSLSSAKVKSEEIKKQFFDSLVIDVIEVTQPTTTGSQTL